jgi:hypothetical protein
MSMTFDYATYNERYLQHFSKKNDYSFKINLAKSKDYRKRSTEALITARKTLDIFFNDRPLIIRLVVWNKDMVDLNFIKKEIIKINEVDVELDLSNSITLSENEKEDTCSLCLYYKRYSFEKISNLVLSVINNEIGRNPALNATFYCINFEDDPFLINIYDDRGLEILFAKNPSEKNYTDLKSLGAVQNIT